MEEFFKLHAKLDKILRYCKDTKYDMFVTTKDSQPNDCDAIVGNHQLFKFPIQCVAELNEFNEKLRDEEYFKLHVEKLRQYYEKSNLSGKAVAYSLIEQLIERPVLTNYTWTGASKYSTNKLRFTDVQNFIKLFFVVINGVDANFTLLDNEDFFKNRVLKYSEIRARDRGTPRRRSAPKAGGPKRKTLIKMLQSSQASSLNYGDLLRPTGDSNIDNLIHDNQQTENN